MGMTNKQKQCLLSFLGLYDGEIDGVWGGGSMTATRKAQQKYGCAVDGLWGPETEEAVLEAVANWKQGTEDNGEPETGRKPGEDSKPDGDEWWDEIEYFKRGEFKCKCGGKYCNGYPAEMKKGTVKTADAVRKRFGPTEVISGLRCPTHNRNVKGVWNSKHMSGKAVDIYVRGAYWPYVLEFVKKQPGVSYAYHIEGSNNVHFEME